MLIFTTLEMVVGTTTLEMDLLERCLKTFENHSKEQNDGANQTRPRGFIYPRSAIQVVPVGQLALRCTGFHNGWERLPALPR